jgi:hypothetical protein
MVLFVEVSVSVEDERQPRWAADPWLLDRGCAVELRFGNHCKDAASCQPNPQARSRCL